MSNPPIGIVLVTGGMGYIGSHTVVQLLLQGTQVVILDNLSNSHAEVINRIEKICGRQPDFMEGDIRDQACLRELFQKKHIDAIIHFAGLKAVGESEVNPLLYYDNNICGSIALFEEMALAGIKKIVFSSSATAYGDPGEACYSESMPLKPINVYGQTKFMVEEILRDLKKSDDTWHIAILRYFNPVGAHISGFMGEDPAGIPNNLMPFIAQVAVGKRDKLSIFGNDYATSDGTGKRDYIHVEDLAAGHLAALEKLYESSDMITVNLGSGKSYSVLEMVSAFERSSGKSIPYEIVTRRTGDLAEYYANPNLAKQVLGWTAKLGIDRMCEDTWRWQSFFPNGYVKSK